MKQMAPLFGLLKSFLQCTNTTLTRRGQSVIGRVSSKNLVHSDLTWTKGVYAWMRFNFTHNAALPKKTRSGKCVPTTFKLAVMASHTSLMQYRPQFHGQWNNYVSMASVENGLPDIDTMLFHSKQNRVRYRFAWVWRGLNTMHVHEIPWSNTTIWWWKHANTCQLYVSTVEVPSLCS